MAENYQLFQYDSCPFCHRVRQFLYENNLDIPLRDTLHDPVARQELIDGGGRQTVPCLRIERINGVEWLYESLAIVRYLSSSGAHDQ